MFFWMIIWGAVDTLFVWNVFQVDLCDESTELKCKTRAGVGLPNLSQKSFSLTAVLFLVAR